MKAVVIRDFGPIGSASVEDVERPCPGQGEVLVDIALAPVNFVDALVLQGRYQFLPDRPFTPGKGPVGTIVAVGPGASRFRIGDRVLAMAEHGGYAEAVAVSEDQCYGLPDAMPFEAAAAISLAYDTAWFALFERGRLQPGETVLALGASGAVGAAAIQLAKAKGARTLAGVASAEKGAAAVAAGADAAIDLSRPGLRDSLREQALAATDGRGVDLIVDPLGGDHFDAAVRALAWRGRIVVVGFAAGRIAELKTNYLLLKNIEASGLQISDYRKRLPDTVRKCFDDIFDLYVAGKIVPSPVSKYESQDYGAALTDLLERRAKGRCVLRLR